VFLSSEDEDFDVSIIVVATEGERIDSNNTLKDFYLQKENTVVRDVFASKEVFVLNYSYIDTQS
jgi:hypothetical protein